jgi:hypothetical protein
MSDDCRAGVDRITQALNKYEEEKAEYVRKKRRWDMQEMQVQARRSGLIEHGAARVRAGRESQAEIDAWVDSATINYRIEVGQGPEPQEPIPPVLTTIVCQDCRQFMNVSGTSIMATGLSQMNQCIAYLDQKGQNVRKQDSISERQQRTENQPTGSKEPQHEPKSVPEPKSAKEPTQPSPKQETKQETKQDTKQETNSNPWPWHHIVLLVLAIVIGLMSLLLSSMILFGFFVVLSAIIVFVVL